MKTKLSSYLWTLVAGLALVAALLWTVASDEPWSDVAFFFFSACFLGSLVASLAIALTRRSRESLYRVAINVIIILLIFFPTRTLGGYLKERIFLMRLPRFQDATDFLIKEELAKGSGHLPSTVASLPSRYSDLPVKGLVHVSSNAGSITVRYFSRNSNALWHGGYVYQSDDNPESIVDGPHNAGYGRVAPHWFFWAE